MMIFRKSAKGAARTTRLSYGRFAPHSVLRELLRSAKGAARTARLSDERTAPHSVLRELLRSNVWISILLLAGLAVNEPDGNPLLHGLGQATRVVGQTANVRREARRQEGDAHDDCS